MNLFLKIFIVAFLSIQFFACGTEPPTGHINHNPVDTGVGTNEFRAIAGTDLVVPVGTVITLDGSSSVNLARLEVTFLWEILSRPSGSSAAIENPDQISTSFHADVDGEFVIRLTMSAVNDTLVSTHQIRITAQTEFVGVRNLRITEIMYDFPVRDLIPGADRIEFVEFKNIGPVEIDLSGVIIDDGIGFAFPQGFTLGAGEFAVLTNETSAAFPTIYPGIEIHGVFSGRLNNDGELLVVRDAQGGILIEINYRDVAPWPTSPRGQGFSLVPTLQNPGPDQNDPRRWRSSSNLYGNPGRNDEGEKIIGVLINEVLAHTDLPEVDFIELFNPANSTVDISGWYLTDNLDEPRMFRFPAGTIVPANGYLVLYAEPIPAVSPIPATHFGSAFGLSQYGEDIFIFSANSEGELTGFSHGFSFDATENGVSLGRVVTSDSVEHLSALSQSSPGEVNTAELVPVGPIVITEILYNPLDNFREFIELQNISDQTVNLFFEGSPDNAWRVGGAGFTFPSSVSLEPGSRIVIFQDTTGTESPDAFRQLHSISPDVQVFSFTGSLQNSGERVTIGRSGPADIVDFALVTPYYTVDEVAYSPASPWPVEAASLGHSIVRINLAEYGNEPQNWRAGSIGGSPGSAD